MGQPAAVMGDRVVGTCPPHQVPNPSSGVPQPGPPMPFSAPLTLGLEPTVTAGGQPVAVVGSSGYNTPPHVGLHISDPFAVPTMQVGRVVAGSTTVLAGGKPMARTGDQGTTCMSPGQVVGSATTVLVG